MTLQVKIDTRELFAAMDRAFLEQIPYGTMLALNKTAEQARSEMLTELDRTLDRPTPWTRNSLRIKYATKSSLVAQVAFKDRAGSEASRSVLQPNVFGGKRHYKAMEARLLGLGLLPSGWNVVPGGAAQLDSYGNMQQGQINQVLNVMQAYATAGAGKTDSKLVARLSKGNKKKGVYGFEYFVVPVNGARAHLAPGIYQRVATGFGTSLKPVLIFVKPANYKGRLDFFAIGQRVIARDLANNLREAMAQAISTAAKK